MRIYDQKRKKEPMKIVTINVPKAYLKTIKKICKIQRNLRTQGYEVPEYIDFPSRSEFVRTAIRDALIKFLSFHENLGQFNDEPRKITLNKLKHFNGNQDKKVLVPEKVNGNTVQEFKTYKIVKRLVF